MEHDTLPPDPDAPRALHDSNVQLREPQAPVIPQRLQRELQRDQPRGLPRFRRSSVDGRRAKPIGWQKPAIVTAAVLGIFALWAFWPSPKFDSDARERWVQLCEDYEQWYVPFVSRLDDNDIVALRDLGLIEAQANIGIYNFNPRYIAGDPRASYADLAANPPKVVRSDAGIAKTRAASSSIDRLLEAFASWPVHTRLRDHLKVIEAHGWERAAKRVRNVLAIAPPRGREPLTESLHLMIGTEDRAGRIAAAASQLDANLAVLARVNDPVLQHFNDTVAAVTDASLTTDNSDDQYLEELGETLQPLAAFGERFQTTLESPGWAGVDYDSFRKEGDTYAVLRDPAFDSNVLFRSWLVEVHRYFAMTHDWRLAWAREMRKQLASALEQAEPLAQAERSDDAEVLRRQVAALQERVDELCEPVLTARESERLTFDRYVIEGDVGNLTALVGDLAARLSATDAVAMMLNDRPLAQGPYRSVVVDARWRAELRALGEQLRRNGDQTEMERDAEDVRTRLYALIDPSGTRSFPQTPTFGADHDTTRSPLAGALRLALTDHCREARETALGELLQSALPVNPHDWDRLRGTYLDTLDASQRLNDLARDTDQMFYEARLPDDPVLRRGGQTLADRIERIGGPLLDEPAVANAAGPILARARVLLSTYRSGTAPTDPAELAGATEPITALAAWAARFASADPAVTATDYDAALERLATVDELELVLARIEPTDRVAHWQNRLNQARRTDWGHLAAAAQTPDQITEALAVADRIAVSRDTMPPRMRFNAWVADLQDAAAADPKATPAQRDAALLQQARAFAKGAMAFGDDPDAGPWIAQVAALTAENQDPSVQFEEAGPIRAGWKLVALADDGTATFARGDHQLQFARLQTPTGPLYLAQAELPVGIALAAAHDAGAGRDLAALLGAAGGEDTRKGPRSWVYDGAANDGLTPLAPNAGRWRNNDDTSTHTQSGPTPQTPLNYVSAETAVYVAGLLGCRLPTDVEWQAATEQSPHPGAAPNLRDAAWADYAQDVAARIKNGERGLAWADSDRLLAAASTDRNTLDHVDDNDAVVWLRPVLEAGGTHGLADLRGNVAELVTRRPVDASALLDPGTGDIQTRLRAFRSAHKDAFAVVGGSALSAPDEPHDQPLSYNLFTGSRGFADVGLRLAFPAPDYSPAQRVRVLLQSPPILGATIAAR